MTVPLVDRPHQYDEHSSEDFGYECFGMHGSTFQGLETTSICYGTVLECRICDTGSFQGSTEVKISICLFSLFPSQLE